MKRCVVVMLLAAVIVSCESTDPTKMYSGSILGFSLESVKDETKNIIASCHVKIENLSDTVLPVFYKELGGFVFCSWSKNPHSQDISDTSAYLKGNYLVRACGDGIIRDESGKLIPKLLSKPKDNPPDMEIPPHGFKVLKLRIPALEIPCRPDDIIFFSIYIRLASNKFNLDTERMNWSVKTNSTGQVYIAVDGNYSPDSPYDGEWDYYKWDSVNRNAPGETQK